MQIYILHKLEKFLNINQNQFVDTHFEVFQGYNGA